MWRPVAGSCGIPSAEAAYLIKPKVVGLSLGPAMNQGNEGQGPCQRRRPFLVRSSTGFKYKHVAGWVLARKVKSSELERSLPNAGRVVLLVVDHRIVGWSEGFTPGEPVGFEAFVLR